MSFLSQNLFNIQPSPTLAASAKAAELKAKGLDIISLTMGEPDFNTPDNISEAAIKAIKNHQTKYTAVEGTPDLKKAILAKFQKENNLSYQLNEIIVGTGAKQVIYNALMATLNQGDEVIIPSPYWVSYPDMVLLAGGMPVFVEGRAENGFKLLPSDLKKVISEKSKWLILNSPSNPTGACYSRQELEGLAQVLLAFPKLHILCDDIYEHLLFDNQTFFALAQIEPKLKERILTVNGVSKAYSMTGWRIGYGAGNSQLIKAMSTIQSQSTSNPCSISQAAAKEALSGPQDYITESRKVFQKRRDLVVKMLNEIPGIDCKTPEGAFYVFPSCKAFFGKTTLEGKVITNSNDFTEYLLEKALVGVVQGIAFGAEGFFRISYAASESFLKNAIERIGEACQHLK